MKNILLAITLILSATTAQALTFDVKKNFIAISGDFVTGDSAKFEQVLKTTNVRNVALHSGGGNATEGYKLGRLFRTNKVTALITEKGGCYSSCAFAFLGAAKRVVLEGGKLGFHATYYSNAKKWNLVELQQQNQKDGMQTAKYFMSMGFGWNVIEMAVEASGDDMKVLTSSYMTANNIAIVK